jgi:Epoxide hydrolase N terminus
MISSSVRRVAAGLVTAASFAVAQTVHTERAVESVASAGLGSTAQPSDSRSIVPFKIQIPNAVLTDVKQRLSRVRFADEFPDAGWDYGTNLAYFQTLVEYWRDKYNWHAG